MVSWRHLTPMARRICPRPLRLLIPIAALAVCFAGGRHAAVAQLFDATEIHDPTAVGTHGLLQVGDDPAYAQPGFDDSKWQPVDAKKSLREYFPTNQQPVVWYRLHVKVSPTHTGLALVATCASQAF